MAAVVSLSRLKPSDLPAPPQAALKMLRACSNPNVSSQELARLAGHDPALTAELLRIVNSAYFAQTKPVQSVTAAVTVLGLRALRNLVLCLTMKDVLNPDVMPGFDIGQYWEESLRRAVGARLLGAKVGLDPEDCFTAGLLQDVGLSVMFLLNPDQKDINWDAFISKDPDARYQAELDLFGTTHEQIDGLLAQTWGLPEDLRQALIYHHQCPEENSSSTLFCLVLQGADWMASVFSARDNTATLGHCQEILGTSFNLSQTEMEDLLAAIPGDVGNVAQSLGLNIAEQIDFDEVMRAANARLAEENLSYQELTWRLQQTIRERDQLAEELNRELALAREIQQRLMPSQTEDNFPVRGINVSARELSGDFFDYFTLPDGRIYFTLGDVSGKGANAALLMTKTASLFRCLGKDLHQPGELTKRLNQEIMETISHGMFVTMIVGLLEPDNNNVTLVNAGHPPALIISPGYKPVAAKAQTPPLGIMDHFNFPEEIFPLNGGCLYLYSDGVIESHGEDGREFGFKGLLETLLQNAMVASKDRLKSIVDALTRFDKTQKDDITLLMIDSGK